MTFKKKLDCRRTISLSHWVLGLLVFAAGCRDLPPLPTVDLAEPGWTVRKAQAVRRPSRQAPEIVGEILVATRGDGRAFVHFSKQLPMQNQRYSRPGQPPARMFWFQLPLVISGRPPPKGWTWRRLEGNRWRLERLSTSEALEIYLAP